MSAPTRNQSLAEATIPVGGATTAHYHRLTEELYLVTSVGDEPLRIVCACAPAYSDEDTVLTED